MWWMMVTFSTFVGVAVSEDPPLSCEDARLKCAYREGCSFALRRYMGTCTSVIQGPNPRVCPEGCLDSLIALTSTVEGQELMKVCYYLINCGITTLLKICHEKWTN